MKVIIQGKKNNPRITRRLLFYSNNILFDKQLSNCQSVRERALWWQNHRPYPAFLLAPTVE